LVTVSTRPEPGSRMALDIEVGPEEVARHFATAYRHLAQRTRVPGFRPGKAPRQIVERYVGRDSVIAEVIDHLVNESLDAALDQTDLIPIDQPDVQIDEASVAESQGVRFTATVSVRPEVTLGSYVDYPFSLEEPEVADADVDQVIDEIRDGQATLRPIDDRGVANGDVVAVSFQGTIDGEPFEGGSADRLPLVVGENRMIPGWEDRLVGMVIGDKRGFDLPFPEDYRVEELRGKQAHFDVELIDLRERVLPEVDDEFAKAVGEVDTVAELRDEIRDALRRRNAAEARHVFGDRIIEFASANASVDLPEVMIANEIDIMRDELRTRLAQQRIGLDQYLALAKQTPEELATELREPASRRVKTLLVLSAIAEKEGIDATDAEIDAEVADQLARYGDEPRIGEYLASRRGRSYLRMTLRNRKVVDALTDRALGAGSETPAADDSAPLAESTPGPDAANVAPDPDPSTASTGSE
jgi:trigger factor